MTKKVVSVVLLAVYAVLVVPPFTVRAQMMQPLEVNLKSDATESASRHTESLDEVMAELLQSQNVAKIQDLDCQKISDTDFERLGDAVMERIHPGQQHERMDEMMGGEGSETLKNAHIQMGRNYLGCWDSSSQALRKGGGGMMGSMMGGGITGGMMRGFGGMMGKGNPWVGGASQTAFGAWWQVNTLLQVIIYLLVIGLLVVLIRYFWKKGSKS